LGRSVISMEKGDHAVFEEFPVRRGKDYQASRDTRGAFGGRGGYFPRGRGRLLSHSGTDTNTRISEIGGPVYP